MQRLKAKNKKSNLQNGVQMHPDGLNWEELINQDTFVKQVWLRGQSASEAQGTFMIIKRKVRYFVLMARRYFFELHVFFL